MRVFWKKHELRFTFNAGTSRGILKSKISYFIFMIDDHGTVGIGECGILPGLSIDDRPDLETNIERLCRLIQESRMVLSDNLYSFLDDQIGNSWPSIRMGFETAFLDLMHGGRRAVFENNFLYGEGIPINGLIWMGDRQFMLDQVRQKIESGFSCIKMKIGALDFETELEILKYIRDQYSVKDMILRVDANGAFLPENVMEKLIQLEKLQIHSIEQPIHAGHWEQMYELCRSTPIPIGLDEELIGDYPIARKKELLESIRPHYLILKPSLLGGFAAAKEWIDLAGSLQIGWWITSALESNIGLNAICQFTYDQGVDMAQGLGTGQLFENNIRSPLEVEKGYIRYDLRGHWDLSIFGIEGIE
jgi:L-alanine-DL-glutamate epimerase-like enolase superfamily enzyme